MSMSKKHYIKIAEALNQALGTDEPVAQALIDKAGSLSPDELKHYLDRLKTDILYHVALSLGDIFRDDNSLFDDSRFIEACFKDGGK